MNINTIRHIKTFTQLPISPMFTPKANDEFTRYIVWSPNQEKFIGEFSFWNDGKITDIFFANTIKGKKSIADTLLSIKNFVINEAKKRNLDKVRVQIPSQTKKELAKTERLLSKLGTLLKKEDISKTDFITLTN